MNHTVLSVLVVLTTAGLAAPPAQAAPRHCPPGLAQKNPPCVPPGQARGDHRWRDDDRHRDRREDRAYRDGYRDGYRIGVGDRLRGSDYRLIGDPRRYGLAPHGGESWRYYLVRDMLVRADPDTLRVLGVIGLARALLD